MISATSPGPVPDLSTVNSAIRSGVVTARDRVEAALALADQYDVDYGVYITRTDAVALATADAADASAAAGDPVLPLSGVTVAIKDLIATDFAPTTAQSRVHPRRLYGGRDAPVVSRLRNAGAAITGKTSLAEHALGRPDPATGFPVPRNPWDPARWPGGSSCGSAIAVALGLADAALGTDTTGSLRIPAAFCGVSGMRPSLGLVPDEGCLPVSASLDAVGPLGRSVRDCAALLAVLAPSTSLPDGTTRASWSRRLDGVRVGVPFDMLAAEEERIHPEIRSLFEAAVVDLENLGAVIVPFAWKTLDEQMAAVMTLAVREGFDVHADRFRTRWADYGRSFRRLCVLGGLVPQQQAADVRSGLPELRARMAQSFADVDTVITPTWAQPAPRYVDGVASGADDLNLTAAWSVSDGPSVSVPMGFDEVGQPASLQLAGAPGKDLDVMVIADAYQTAHPEHLRQPKPRRGPFPAVPDPDAKAPMPTPDQIARVRTALRGLDIVPTDADVPAIDAMLSALQTSPAL